MATLYRCYAYNRNRLLYVGVTRQTIECRMASHRLYSRWYKFMRHIETQVCTTLQDAKTQETKAIIAEKPYYNKIMYDGHQSSFRKKHPDWVRELLAEQAKRAS